MHAKHRYYRELGFLSIFALLYSFASPYCYGIYNITSFQALSQGQNLFSPSQIFELGFFTPNSSGNQYVGIWYSKQISPSKVVVWIANRDNPLAVTDSAASLTIGSNGNLNLVDGKEKSVWSTNTRFSSNTSVAVLFDNGSLVLREVISGQVLWQSFEHLGDTLLPLAKVGFNVQTGERFVLTSWKTETDPSPGNFTFGLSQQRPPQAFVWINGSTPHWRSGPWDNTKFIGVPEMAPIYLNAFKLVEDVDQGTTTFFFNPDYYCYMFISSEGVLKLMAKDNDTDWYVEWQAPNSTCEAYGACGPYAFCKTNEWESAVCKCLKGFVPKSKEEWSKGNWTGGCVRRSKLECEKNNGSSSSGGKKDGFWKKGVMKLPDFYTFVPFVDADSCGRWCLSNCSCIAYAFVNGIGCLVWSNNLIDIQEFPDGGEDLFLRLAHSELVGGQQIKKVIISLATICASAILGGLFFAWYRLRAKQNGKIKDIMKQPDLIEKNDNKRDNLQSHDPCELAIFDYDSILVATDHFNISNKLGQGGFGSVYEGKLNDGKEIAVKRLSSNSVQGIEEFKNEIILISKLQHRNLVKLLGCCMYKEEKLLIYEFMPNKSLDFFLFDPRRRSELNWATRFNIIHGVAKGILYLHRDSSLRVIHRDLKASNILLDVKMNAKISDFGLARIFPETIDLANTQRVVGTLGYMSPEYAMGGIFSEKSDVYSFGVLLLEIVSGKKNNSFHHLDQHLSLIAYAWQLWSECRALELMDEALTNSLCSSEVMRCIDVGLLCTQDHAVDRPTMPEVVFMLSNETDRPKPKQPFSYPQGSLKFDLQPQSGSKCSTNAATISMLEGR